MDGSVDPQGVAPCTNSRDLEEKKKKTPSTRILCDCMSLASSILEIQQATIAELVNLTVFYLMNMTFTASDYQNHLLHINKTTKQIEGDQNADTIFFLDWPWHTYMPLSQTHLRT